MKEKWADFWDKVNIALNAVIEGCSSQAENKRGMRRGDYAIAGFKVS
ncbi:hypothetical protein [Calothrix sp. NIES-3974]|nr:hypothetical protein [Calothrix sp. NIES-3974]